jgi:DNA topoisomerase-2
MIYRFRTPLYIVQAGKQELEFFTDDEYKEWSKAGIKHSFEYYKGLGSFSSSQFKKFLENREKYLIKVEKLEAPDIEKISLAFSNKEADNRKEWLSDASYFMSYD